MAASTNRDVTLTVQAETIGENSIREMADQIRALGKTGSDTAPQFVALAQQLDALADNQRAIQTLQDLDVAMEQTATLVTEAAASYDAASVKVAEQATALDTLRTKQGQANDTLAQAKQTLIDAREAYALLRADVISHTEKTDSDRQALSAAAAAQANATAELQRARIAYAELKPDVKAASDELDRLQKSANFANRELSNAQGVAATQAQAYTVATEAAQALGIQTTALADEQARLLDTQNAIATGAERLQTAQAAQAEAQRLLAQETVALQQATLTLERELQAEEQAILKATAATALERQEKADAAAAEQLYARSVEEVNAALYDMAQAQEAAAADATAARLREDAAAALAAAEAYDAFMEATRELDAVLQAEQQAQLALAEAKAEQAESDRLAIIQINSSFEARKNGVIALQAELAAINELAVADAEAAAAQAKLNAQLEATAASAKAAGDALSGAFSNLGVRSLQDIQAEVTQVERSMGLLRANFEAGAISSQDMARAVGAATVQLEALRAEAAGIPALDGAFKSISGTINGIISDFGALGAAVATVGFAIKPILDANIQLETTRRTLTQVLGSVSAANEEIGKLAGAADRVGVSVGGLNTSFSTFAAAAKTAGLSTQQVEQIFNSTVGAAGTLGLSGEKVTLILEALGQMASKGVVSMEELRRQLGNSLPGALALMAQSLGITTAQLDKLVSTGNLLASDALPALAQAMAKIGDQTKPVEGLQQSFARLGNAVTETFQKFSQTSAYTLLNAAVSSLAKNFSEVLTVVTSLGELWAAKSILTYLDGVSRLDAGISGLTGSTRAATVATVENTVAEEASTAAATANTAVRDANAVATRAQTAAQAAQTASIGTSGAAFQANSTVLQSAAGAASGAFGVLRGAVGGVFSLLGGIPGIALLVLSNAKAIGTAIGETAASWAGWGDQLKKNEAALDAQTAKETAAYQASQVLGSTIVKLTAAYADLTSPLAKATEAAEKHAEAQKLEGDAANAIARISGDVTIQADAQARATSLQAQAAQGVADKLNLQAQATANLIANIQSQVAAGLKLNDAEQKKLTTFQQTLTVQQAAAEKAQAQADADNIAAAAAFNHAVSLQDQSKSLASLQDALAGATLKVQALQTAQALGADVNKQLTAAELAQAEALSLVNKALQDTITNSQRTAQVTADKSTVTEAAAKTEQAYWQQQKQVALSLGDTQAARAADINSLNAQEDATNAAIRAKQGDITAINAQIQALTAKAALQSGAAQQATLDEIEALKTKVAVEQQDVQQMDIQNDSLQLQVDTLTRNTAATDANTAAKKANAAAAAAAAANAGVSSTGLTKNGGPNGTFNNSLPLDEVYAVLAKSKAGSLGPDDLAEAQAALAQAKNANDFLHSASDANAAIVDPQARLTTGAQLTQLQGIVAQLLAAQQAAAKTATPSSSAGDTTQTSAAATKSSSSHTVTINLNGQSTVVGVQTAADGATLTALLAQLSSAATRAQ